MSRPELRRLLGRLHVLAAWLLVAAIVFQVFLAAVALPNLGGSGSFAWHVEFGYTGLGLLALVVVLTAVAAGVDRRGTVTAFSLLVLYFIQTMLPALRAVSPALAALHVVNALALFGLAAWYAMRAQRRLNQGQAAT